MEKPLLHIECFTLGDWQTNCYVIDAGGSSCWVIDAGFNAAPMVEYLHERELTPTHLILTHAHVDHIAGVATLFEAFPDMTLMIDSREQAFLTNPELNLSIHLPEPIVIEKPPEFLHPGDTLTLDDWTFEVRDTAGHSPGGISLCCIEADLAVVGDALFAGSIGRYDFPTSDGPLLMKNIHEQLLTLPDGVVIYAGHGPETTIGYERQNNPFLS